MQSPITNILQELETESGSNVNFYVVKTKRLKNERLFDVFKPEITQSIGTELINNAKNFLSTLANSNDVIFRNYKPGVTYDKPCIEKIAVEDVETVKYISEKSLYEVNYPPLSKDDYKYLWSYHYVVNRKYIFFRLILNKKLLRQKGGFLAIFNGNVFNAISKEFLIIEDKIDFMLDSERNIVYIFNKDRFEIAANFYDKWKREVNQHLPDFFQKVTIDNTEFFTERLFRDIRKVKKMYNILSSKLYHVITTQVIKKISEDFGLSIAFSEDGNTILVDETNDWDLLKALDDDHLISHYTNNKYEVQSKVKKQ